MILVRAHLPTGSTIVKGDTHCGKCLSLTLAAERPPPAMEAGLADVWSLDEIARLAN